MIADVQSPIHKQSHLQTGLWSLIVLWRSQSVCFECAVACFVGYSIAKVFLNNSAKYLVVPQWLLLSEYRFPIICHFQNTWKGLFQNVPTIRNLIFFWLETDVHKTVRNKSATFQVG